MFDGFSYVYQFTAVKTDHRIFCCRERGRKGEREGEREYMRERERRGGKWIMYNYIALDFINLNTLIVCVLITFQIDFTSRKFKLKESYFRNTLLWIIDYCKN